MRKRACLALVLVPLLGGCLAAVALPLVAGGSLMARDRLRVGAATQVPGHAASSGRAKRNSRKAKKPAAASSTVVVTSLTELPPPSGPSQASADDPWQLFFAYALEQAATGEGKGKLQSALLASPPSLEQPARRDCLSPHPAVVIDLDPGQGPFEPDRPISSPPGVSQGLARLREADVVVLWISRLPAARAADVARALQTSGLDPQGQDQLLLVRAAGDRKQLLREDANKDVCIVAVAGDQRGDFDELFDYLRNPDATIGLDSVMGKGWFLVPAFGGPVPAAK